MYPRVLKYKICFLLEKIISYPHKGVKRYSGNGTEAGKMIV